MAKYNNLRTHYDIYYYSEPFLNSGVYMKGEMHNWATQRNISFMKHKIT